MSPRRLRIDGLHAQTSLPVYCILVTFAPEHCLFLARHVTLFRVPATFPSPTIYFPSPTPQLLMENGCRSVPLPCVPPSRPFLIELLGAASELCVRGVGLTKIKGPFPPIRDAIIGAKLCSVPSQGNSSSGNPFKGAVKAPRALHSKAGSLLHNIGYIITM